MAFASSYVTPPRYYAASLLWILYWLRNRLSCLPDSHPSFQQLNFEFPQQKLDFPSLTALPLCQHCVGQCQPSFGCLSVLSLPRTLQKFLPPDSHCPFAARSPQSIFFLRTSHFRKSIFLISLCVLQMTPKPLLISSCWTTNGLDYILSKGADCFALIRGFF